MIVGARTWSLLASCALVGVAGDAVAWDVVAFPPAAVGRGGYSVQATDTLWKGDGGAQIVYTFLHRPVEGSQGTLIRYAQLLEFQAAYGLVDRLELDVQLPVHVDRTVAIPNAGLAGTGMGDLRVGFKYQILQRTRSDFGVSVSPFLLLATGSAAKITGSDNQNFGATVAADKQFGFLTVGLNVGMTRRVDRSWSAVAPRLRLYTTVDYGLVMQFALPLRWSVVFLEYAGMYEVVGKHGYPMEASTGIRLPIGPLDVTLGYLRGLTSFYGSPANLAFLGIGIYHWPSAAERFQ